VAEGTIEAGTVDGTATLTITNPARKNAMTASMWRQLIDLVTRFTKDPQVRVLVLTGAGDIFCAGADITELDAIHSQSDDLAAVAGAALAGCPKPVIAALNGDCIGGGALLASACDLRLAVSSARLAITPAKLGVIYPVDATERLIRLIGPAAAKHLLFSAEFVDSARAQRIGFFDEVIDAGRFTERVVQLARRLGEMSQVTVRASKQLVDRLSSGVPAGELAELADCWMTLAQATDHPEGITAFAQRRAPDFHWNG
jgi:enoyl-CoA hydratase/carnithine racemase